MKLLIIIIAGVIAGIILLVALIALIGSQLPKAHVASRSVLLHQSPQNVYAVIRDFAAAPNWRRDVKRIDVETLPDGQIHFSEQGKNGTINYELAEDVPTKRMVMRILDRILVIQENGSLCL